MEVQYGDYDTKRFYSNNCRDVTCVQVIYYSVYVLFGPSGRRLRHSSVGWCARPGSNETMPRARVYFRRSTRARLETRSNFRYAFSPLTCVSYVRPLITFDHYSRGRAAAVVGQTGFFFLLSGPGVLYRGGPEKITNVAPSRRRNTDARPRPRRRWVRLIGSVKYKCGRR